MWLDIAINFLPAHEVEGWCGRFDYFLADNRFGKSCRGVEPFSERV
jgi:hypothetical protein